MKIIDSKKEFIKFCKENNINCVKKDYCFSIELPDNVVCITEYANFMGVHYEVKEVDNKIIITSKEYPYKSGISYETSYTFDNSDNQVLAVCGLWCGFNVLIKSKDNQRDKMEKILEWNFHGE